MKSRNSVLLATLLLAGCAHLARTYDVAPDGLQRGEHEFRRYLSTGRADSALLQLDRNNLPNDVLLRLLFEGVAAHYAGEHDRSAQVFEAASLITDDRSTKSVSQTALSLVVNDFSLAYEPSRAEKLLLPYFPALSYASTGRFEDAAVEARRLSAQLQLLADQGRAPARSTQAFFRYFAGVLFEAAGEHGDADVAYRNAATLDSVAYANRSGNVVLLLERGFAPHRVQESLIVLLSPDESRGFESDDERDRTSESVTQRILQFAGSAGPRTGDPRQRTLWVPAPTDTKASKARDEDCDSTCEDDDDESYLLRMSWPVMYAPPAYGASGVQIDSQMVTRVGGVDIASEVLGDFQREQPAIIARTVARAASKYVLSRSAEKKFGKKHEGLGNVVGALANITGALTEQADTRSWHLLPGAIDLIRLQLPPGPHRLVIDGADYGVFTVRANGATVLSRRIWQ